MMRKFIPFLLSLIFSVGWVAAQVEDCPALVANALSRAQLACAATEGNQACYGYQTLSAELSPGLSEFAFNGVGDITPVDTIHALRLSALDPVTDQWGVAIMRIHADIAEDQPDQNVTLVAFGEVSLNPDTSGDYQPMQAFTFSTDENSSGCTDVTENGLLIQTPEGVGKVTLWLNQVKIRIGSTVLFQAQPGGDLVVSTFEGSAQVEALGQMQEAVAGTTVYVPMNNDLQPSAPPTVPQPFDMEAAGLVPVVDVITSFTDQTVNQLIAVDDDTSLVDTNNDGIPDSPADSTSVNDCNGEVSGNCFGQNNGNDCNGDHGNGNPNGNCFGHDNGNNGNGNNGNGNGNNGNGNGNNGNGKP
jgi:hypothetical protein